MALAKLGLMSELVQVPLVLLLQRKLKGDNHYQLATREYCDRLRELYRASVRDGRRAAVALRQARKLAHALSEETFKLTVARDGELPGIALARAGLPLAETGDQVELLLLPPGDASEDEWAPLARGLVTLANEEQVRIKFQEPLKGRGKSESEAKQEEATGGGVSAGGGKAEAQPEPELEEIRFKVRFVPSARTTPSEASQDEQEDELAQLIDEALRNFAKLKCNQALHRILMGLYDERADLPAQNGGRPRVLTAFGADLRPRPSAQQRAAIEQALKRRLALIEGPAGTGKSFVAALVAVSAGGLRQGRVLVCSPVQTTVDRLTELLMGMAGGALQVIKLPESASEASSHHHQRRPRGLLNGRRRSAASRRSPRRPNADDGEDDEHGLAESDQDEDEPLQAEANRCHLNKIVDDEIYLQAYARSKGTLGRNHEQLHSHAYRMVSSCAPRKRREMEAKLISKANVICCTPGQAASYLPKGPQFDLLVLDDAHVLSELDCLVAMMTARGVKQVTLLSDTRRRIRLARSRLSASTPDNSTELVEAKNSSTGNNCSSATQVKQREASASLRSLRSSFPGADSSRAGKRSAPTKRPARRGSENSLSGESSTTDVNEPARLAEPENLPRVSLEPGNLFERLLSLGLPTVDLRVQYRCHATLSNFFSHHFYAGRLKNDRRTNDKLTAEINSSLLVREQNFAWLPNRKYLTALLQVGDHASCSLDQLEEQVHATLNLLLSNENIQESRIGVVYNRPSLLRRAQQKRSRRLPSELRQATIVEFLGLERDFIILVAGSSNLIDTNSDLHDSGTQAHLGLTTKINCDFRSNDAALNWAITRAKLGLFIVADALGSGAPSHDNNTSSGDSTARPEADCGSWRDLVKYYATNKLTKSSCVASPIQADTLITCS